MGGCTSTKTLDDNVLRSPTVLHLKGDSTKYHGTTERRRLQTLGHAELLLNEEGIYSQVIKVGCCCSGGGARRGYLHIPLRSIENVRQQAWFNGLYRLDRPHLVVTYSLPGKESYQAGWQMNQTMYDQWERAIEQLIERFITVDGVCFS